MAKFAKSVAFNEKNEKDRAILKHISRRNFSGYVKKLILKDIEKKEVEKEKVQLKHTENNTKQPHTTKHQIKPKQNISSPLINLPKK